MVDSLSRSPSPVNTPSQISQPAGGANSLSQGPASRSQSPGATSLVNQGRSAREMPSLQQGSLSRASRADRSSAPSPTSRQPSPGGAFTPLSAALLQSLADEVNRPSPRQALRTWAQQVGTGELRGRALSLINTARSNGARELDLNGLGLTSLPEGFGRLLPTVTSLDLEGNQLDSVGALAGMSSLKFLDISGNRLESLSSLPPLRSLQALSAQGNPLQAPDDSLVHRLPALARAHPVNMLTLAQQNELRAQERELYSASLAADSDTDSDSGSEIAQSMGMSSVAGLADREDYQTPIHEAAKRWGSSRNIDRAEEQALAFYRSVMPDALHHQLQTDTASRSLLTLTAGMAFTADNDPDRTRPADAPPSASKAALAADFEYLANAKDPTLLTDCQNAADGAVNRCGDRIGYGATQLHQVIEAHQFKTGVLSAKELFAGKARHFNQALVEAKAADIAGSTAPRESVEYYQDLAGKVAAKGRPLVETGISSLYGGNFAVNDQQVQETLDLIDAKNSNPAYLDTFKEHQTTVNEVLRRVFSSDYSTLLTQRSKDESTATDIMLNPKKTSAEQFEAGVRLGELGRLENQWYAAKLPVLLNNPELLAQLK